MVAVKGGSGLWPQMGMSAWPIRVVHRVGDGSPAYLIDFEDPDFQGAREGYAAAIIALQGFAGFYRVGMRLLGNTEQVFYPQPHVSASFG